MNASCQCGAVSFKTPLAKPLAIYICHCDECRRQSSSAFGCSAIFPRFELPCKEALSCYSRPTASGHTLNCYFCRNCGTRVIHTTPGKGVLSVKGGCIEGLDWKSAKHIWCKRAMVPIPEGVERSDGEPDDDDGLGVGVVPRDKDGGVGGASTLIQWTGNRAGLEREWGGEGGGMMGREVGGAGDGSGSGSGSRGKGKGKETEKIADVDWNVNVGAGVEESQRQGEIEREIVEMTRRFERKQMAKKMQSEKH
ncbi:hypothetical protein LHYA1_G006402 [Lachnellula hyalina]|uniref:CENP-V/GFA domain-containing protein n=1 Tax=Lachnellula hyalina TaxID=1316788 RepID=A0A8H8QZH5_9HELO|nr:uncharacterized protein LHYA1_G006402 [Lachnellula hyalina]TVY24630.1 hypothetical protein LHYA1_G006402 [Lachnellula hyalina]